MNGSTDFIDKWRARWPEWNIGAAFLPAMQRDTAFAWFALLQELSDAAWSGADATPGLAKLAWWNEELLGWEKGARRHPLGDALQRRAASWAALAAALRELQASRESPPAADPAATGLDRFARAVGQCEQALFGAEDITVSVCRVVLFDLLGERCLLHDDHATARELLEAWPGGADAQRARRLHSAFVRQRLRLLCADAPNRAPSPWRSLWLAWHAARPGS